ncbi:MAG TPA: TIGR02588 family protein [Longimicrobiales bacterium]|nr:TIGR02588 family protein [Longimicrobiales bacterium]
MPARRKTSITSRWEWVAAAVSALLVAGLISLLASQALRPRSPPDLRVSVDAVERRDGQHLVRFTIRNRGTETAADLHVEGELQQAGETVERSTAVLDYVPGGAARQGGVFFARDPRAYTLRVVPRGYQVP